MNRRVYINFGRVYCYGNEISYYKKGEHYKVPDLSDWSLDEEEELRLSLENLAYVSTTDEEDRILEPLVLSVHYNVGDENRSKELYDALRELDLPIAEGSILHVLEGFIYRLEMHVYLVSIGKGIILLDKNRSVRIA